MLTFGEDLRQISEPIHFTTMDIMKLLQDQLTETVISQLASQVGGTPEQTSSVSSSILNTLVGALAKNGASEDGASSIFNALEKDHDGSLLDNLSDYLNPEAANPVPDSTANGFGILEHLLGDKKDPMSEMLAQSSGMDKSNIIGLMAKLAPIVMAALGKTKNQGGSGGFSITDLMGLLSNERQSINQQEEQRRRQAPPQEQESGGIGGMLKLLDFDGDGNPLNDAMGLLNKFMRK